MKFNKKNIMFLITYAVILFCVLQRFELVQSILFWLFKILVPFLMGIGLAFILNVLLKKIEEKWLAKIKNKFVKKHKRAISLSLTLIISFGIIILLIFFIIPELWDAITILFNQLPGYIENVERLLNDKFNLGINIETIDWAGIQTKFLSFFSNNTSNIIDTTISITATIVNSIVNIVIAVILACYILSNKEFLGRQFRKLMDAFIPKYKEDILDVTDLSQKSFSNFVTGQFTEALILGGLCFIGMFILRIPYASMISILVGVTALIPAVGAVIGCVVGTMLILTINPIKAIWFIIFFLILQQIESNLIYPKVMGKSVGLPSVWVFVAITLGGGIFGIIGMLLAVPICSILYTVLKLKVNKKLEKKTIENQ